MVEKLVLKKLKKEMRRLRRKQKKHKSIIKDFSDKNYAKYSKELAKIVKSKDKKAILKKYDELLNIYFEEYKKVGKIFNGLETKVLPKFFNLFNHFNKHKLFGFKRKN